MQRLGLLMILAMVIVTASCERREEHHGLVKAVAKGQSKPSESGVGTPVVGSGDFPAPPADSPFIGTWEQTSQTERRSMSIRFTLTGDGLFLAEGAIEERETGDRATITVHGRWSVSGEAVVMRVEATDQPGVFAPSSVLTYAGSGTDAESWNYTDASGRARSMSRVVGHSENSR